MPTLEEMLASNMVPAPGYGAFQRTTPGNEGPAVGLGPDPRMLQLTQGPSEPQPLPQFGEGVAVRKNQFGQDEFGVVTPTTGFVPIAGNPGTYSFEQGKAEIQGRDMIARQPPTPLDMKVEEHRSRIEDRIARMREAREARLSREELARQMLELRKEMRDTAPLTEVQGKSSMFGTRAAQADLILHKYEDIIDKEGLMAAQAVPFGLGNYFLNANQQRVDQAQRDFVNAVLRQESGAAISAGEFENAKRQYFAQPGDTKEVIAQKRQNRKLAIQGFKRQAGRGAKDIEAIEAGGVQSPDGWSIKKL